MTEKNYAAGPKAEQCGCVKDRYGLSWQIVPASIGAWQQNLAQL
ncbi:VOC family protein [Aerococcus viridans]